MEVAIKINGTKEISLNPETPLEQEYLPLIFFLVSSDIPRVEFERIILSRLFSLNFCGFPDVASDSFFLCSSDKCRPLLDALNLIPIMIFSASVIFLPFPPSPPKVELYPFLWLVVLYRFMSSISFCLASCSDRFS